MSSPGGLSYNKLADPALLDKIDKLFSCNVGNHIDLPQLVVVGDQSSGKSSVLEGLTNLPFPRDSGLCTRFPTHITFRRAPEKSIAVSIIPQADASEEHVKRVKDWNFALKTLDAPSFAEIMKQVRLVMGLVGPEQNLASPTNFSNDILRLEICGPVEDHLSVIDIPGIFKNTTPGITTKEDIEMVRRMVHDYMRNPRSVMLTVVPANVDIATQEIVEMAKELDPEGCRTLGVLTKPDLVDKGAEQGIVDLVAGKQSGTKIRWSVVRNPGQKELQDGNVDRQLEKVKLEIGKRLKVATETLDSLGGERDTTTKQKRYLFDMVTKFQKLTYDAVTANYGRDDLFEKQLGLRLATKLAQRNDLFTNHMEKWGQKYSFVNRGVTKGKADSGAGVGTPAKVLELNVRTTSSTADIKAILHGHEKISYPLDDILTWLEKTYLGVRGFELGTFNPSSLQVIMKMQSTKWTNLAMGYISDAVVIVHRFIVEVLELVCPDGTVRSRLLTLMQCDLIERYKDAIAQVRFLLSVERDGTCLTQNHYFNDNLEKAHQERMRSAMEEKAVVVGQMGKVVKVDSVIQHPSMSNAKHVVQTLHDVLGAYYKVARKRFVDNVCLQGTDYYLVSGPKNPLNLLSPAYIEDLTPSQLEHIAGEDASLMQKRQQLKREISDLEAGRKILTDSQ